MFYGPHSDIMFSEVYYGISQKGVVSVNSNSIGAECNPPPPPPY